MSITFGSGQTSGQPLSVTATTAAGAQTLHTAVAGAGTPDLVSVTAINADALNHTLYLVVAGTTIPLVLPPGGTLSYLPSFPLNGSKTVKVYADTASVLSVSASVNNQSASGVTVQEIFSGLVAAAQNASRYGFNQSGGTGQTTETNAEVVISKAGTIQNLKAVASAAVGGGATVTVGVRQNGATVMSLTLANADGTAIKTSTSAPVTVAAGDLVTFLVSCDNAGAPAANIQAVAELLC